MVTIRFVRPTWACRSKTSLKQNICGRERVKIILSRFFCRLGCICVNKSTSSLIKWDIHAFAIIRRIFMIIRAVGVFAYLALLDRHEKRLGSASKALCSISLKAFDKEVNPFYSGIRSNQALMIIPCLARARGEKL